jgi:hypothetical protein
LWGYRFSNIVSYSKERRFYQVTRMVSDPLCLSSSSALHFLLLFLRPPPC